MNRVCREKRGGGAEPNCCTPEWRVSVRTRVPHKLLLVQRRKENSGELEDRTVQDGDRR